MAAQFGNHDAGVCSRYFHDVALVLHGDAEHAVELARHQGAHLLDLRALTSLVHATQDPQRTVELLPRVAVLLEQLTLRPESADARDARLLVPGRPTAR
jgi:hypothetical protein